MNKRRKQCKRVFKLLMIPILCIIVIIIGQVACKKTMEQNDFILIEETEAQSQKIKMQRNLNTTNLHSKNVYLWNRTKGQEEWSLKANERIYPASLTKILTAIVCLESQYSMSDSFEVPKDIFEMLYKENASVAGFLPGEVVTMKDLLYGVMLPSGAECCITLARQVFGSEAQLVKKMNQKAAELGMVNSHFCNSIGLWEKQHYTTVHDMGILLNYALQNNEFRKIFTSNRYSVMPTNKHLEGFTFHSTMFSLVDDRNISYGELLGGKTGYTKEAGLCLASLARIGEEEYILVTAKAEGNHQTESFHIKDAVYIYNQLN